MRALGDGFACSNVSVTQSFIISLGGVFVLDVVGANFGSVTLERLGPDNSTYLTAATALTANGTTGAVALPAGQYELVIASATGVYASLVRVPGE